MSGHLDIIGLNEYYGWYNPDFDELVMLGKLDYVKGISPWILYDFRAVRRMNRFQNGWNRKGLIAQDKRTKKQAFAVLRDFYRAVAQNT